jgi:DUF2892 family protein
MTVERYLRMIAGTFVLATLALGYWVSPYWFLFTAFVGLNLFQSAFTNWCPMMTFLRKLGVREPDGAASHASAASIGHGR